MDRYHLSPEAFCRWLQAMRDAGIAETDRSAGALLGLSANSVVKMKRDGADQRTALACTALLKRLKPYN